MLAPWESMGMIQLSILESVAERYRVTADFYQYILDPAQDAYLVRLFNINQLPALLILWQGELIKRKIGPVRADELTSILDELL